MYIYLIILREARFEPYKIVNFNQHSGLEQQQKKLDSSLPFARTSNSQIQMVGSLPGPLPIGQVSMKFFLPSQDCF